MTSKESCIPPLPKPDGYDRRVEGHYSAVSMLEFAALTAINVRRDSHEEIRKYKAQAIDWQRIARERTADVGKADAEIERVRGLIVRIHEAYEEGEDEDLAIAIDEAGRNVARPAPEPEHERPVAWLRGVQTPSSPDGPGDYDEECVPGYDRPSGDGWCPLYSRPALPPPTDQVAAAAARVANEIGLFDEEDPFKDDLRVLVAAVRASQPSEECQHHETVDLEDANARWCTECGAFHDGALWIHPRRLAQPPCAEPPYRVRSFWTPCRKYIANACVSVDDISIVDDNGKLWEPTGPEQDMTKRPTPTKEPEHG